MDISTTKFPIKHFEDGEYSEVLDDVLEEYILSIYLENKLITKLICVPEYLEELVLGYLYSDGLISSAADVEAIQFEGQAARVKRYSDDLIPSAADVEAIQFEGQAARVKRYSDGLISSAADVEAIQFEGQAAWVRLRGGVQPMSAASPEDADMVFADSGDFVGLPYKFKRPDYGAVMKSAEWTPDVILNNANLLLEKSRIFRETGNVHSVMICRGAEMLYFCEDIGRYNAFDKCVGRALKDKTDLSTACVYTSGRIPSSIALKTLRAGIPMIVSRSAPTDKTLAIAAEYGLTVIGFARGGRFNLYTG